MLSTDKSAFFPLTIPQKEIWFDQILAPDSVLYNIAGYCEIGSLVVPDLLEKAIHDTAEVLDALQLRFFSDENGRPFQYFSDSPCSQFSFEDLSDCDFNEAKLEEILLEFQRKPFALLHGPLYRYKLLKRARNSYVWVFVFHHLITDGWSASIINNRIAENYNRSLDGLPPVAEGQTYRDFIEDDETYRLSERFESQRAYWKDKIHTLPALPFKQQYRHPSDRIPFAGQRRMRVRRSVWEGLEATASRIKTTAFPAFLATLYAYLHLFEKAEGCLVGYPTLNRAGKFKKTPGMFATVSVGYFDYGTRVSFLELVKLISAELKENYRNTRFPISEVLRNAKSGDAPAGRAFDVTVSYEKHPHLYPLGDVSVKAEVLGGLVQRNPLNIQITDYDPNDDVVINLAYHRDYFDDAGIQLFEERILWLFECFVTQPETPVNHLYLLNSSECKLIQQWNLPAFELPLDTTVLDLFQKQVNLHSCQPALVLDGESMSYQALDSASNRIAHLLRSEGIVADDIVAVCLNRRMELYVSILGILKAGAAYLPLDPNTPEARIAETIADAGCVRLISSGEFRDRIGDASTIWIDEVDTKARLSGFSDLHPAPMHSQENLAYIIYTSGSTGKPKGVMIEHRSLLNAVLSYHRSWDPQPGERVLQQASIAFDVSVCEIFPFLCSGGTVVVGKKEALLHPRDFANFVVDHQINSLGATPSLLNNLQEIGEKIPCVRSIFSGGESLNFGDIRQLLPHARVVNGYGPTEATVGATAYLLSELDSDRIRIPIGKPLLNYEVYILDEYQNLLPRGISGELCIGGAGLARGYLNRKELTAEKFVVCQIFGEEKRLYRTGDLARWLPDGNIEFLGRLDSQVKLRGYRIELGEIESAIRLQPGIKDAVVVLDAEGTSNARLIAYYLSEEPEVSLHHEGLIDALKRTLPSYMIPLLWVKLEVFPLTTSGKIDVRALPVPDLHENQETRIPPNTETERKLAEIWSEVLGNPIESVNADFFEWGGHSLLSTQVISQIRDHWAVSLTFQDFFDKSRLKEQAARIDSLRTASTVMQAVSPLCKADRLEPSLAQLRLLFLAQLDERETLYDMFAAIQLEGLLDEDCFERSLIQLIDLHDSLRSSFPMTKNGPQLVILDSFNPLTCVDISALSPEKKDSQLKELCRMEQAHPLDLERGPLIRFLKIRLAQDLQVVCLKMHHTIGDGWSTEVLFEQWSRLYSDCRSGNGFSWEKPQLQYPDFAIWQKQWLKTPACKKQLDYWTAQLAGLPERIELPTDHPRPQQLRYRGRHLRSRLPSALAAQVRSFSKACQATDFMVLLAAFDVLLARYSGQDDFAVGSPIANRNDSKIEQMIGLFVNTLVFRARLRADESFEELVLKTRTTTLEAFNNQDLPLETLVEAMNPERSLSHAPLFQVLFVFQAASTFGPRFEALEATFLTPEYEVAKFDLTLSIFCDSEEFVCEWEYDTDLYEHATIERMSVHFRHLLERLLADPSKPALRHDLLSPQETETFRGWNQTSMPIPDGITCLDLFAEQVNSHPDHPALQWRNRSLNYREVDVRSDAVACRLRTMGIAGEDLVALCMERCPDAIVAILGILKAGAAFVPIDSTIPENRIVFTMEDCQAKVLVTHAPVAGRLMLPENQYLDMDALFAAEESLECVSPVAVRPDPHSLAYMIYTSGSTGKPKGVMIEHMGLLNMLLGYQHRYQPGPTDRSLQQASLAFDVGVAEIFTTLCSGGTLVIVEKDTVLDADRFKIFLQEQRITMLGATPTLLTNLRVNPGELPDVRVIFSGGEAATWKSLSPLLKHARVENGYGPTEASISTTVYTLESTDGSRHSLPIGKALPNYRVFVLDKNLLPLPIGVPGELCIAGIGLARGYWNQTQLTQEKFTQQFLFGVNERIYHTGDLVRWLPDGNLEFIGRKDHQVKLRGFRIELGEIENAISTLDFIKEVVVVVRSIGLHQRLVAYVTLVHPIERVSQRIQEILTGELPAYMIPGIVWVVPSFPLTANGKIDRNKLPDPGDDVFEMERLPPCDEIEHALCEIWSALFGHPVQTVNLDFFNAGGHSLLATQLASRIRERFRVDYALRLIFEQKDIANQAKWLRANGAVTDGVDPLDLTLTGHTGTELSYAQQRLWFIHRLEETSTAYHICCFLRFTGQVNQTALERALVHIVERHETLRSRFYEQEGSPKVEIRGTYDPLRIEPSAIEAEAVDGLVREFAESPMRLDTDWLFQAQWCPIKGDSTHSLLLLKMHHIVSDGWSQEILIRELVAGYNAFSADKTPELTPLQMQYGDYAAEQKKWLSGEVIEQQLAYWRQQLKGIPGCIELPTDFPRPPVMSSRGSFLQTVWSHELTASVHRFSKRRGVTPFMTLLAAFNILLSRYCRTEDVVVGSPVANRNRKSIEPLIGFFVNTLVLRSTIDPDVCFEAIVERVKLNTLDAFSHQDVPFEMIVEALNPERNLSHSPLFQVVFTYRNATEGEVGFEGITSEFLTPAGDQIPVKTDLMLEITESDGRLSCNWAYCTDLFLRQGILRMAQCFEFLIQGLLSKPKHSLSQIPLLNPEGQHQLLEWNCSRRSYDLEKTVDQLIREQALKHPTHWALAFGNQRLRYLQLEQLSNQLAHALRKLGVQKETPVALCMERSLEYSVFILAIIKAGGAFVPIDPGFPAARLRHILEDSDAFLLLTQEALRDDLPESGVAVLTASEFLDSAKSLPVEPPETEHDKSSLAYIIYTSGSTGLPKGVLIEHRGLTNLVHAKNEWFHLSHTDRYFQQASYAFDFSVMNTFVALTHGATLITSDTETLLDPQKLVAFLREQKVSVTGVTPSLFSNLELTAEKVPDLRLIISGGEAFVLGQQHASLLTHTRIINAYGPTEVTVAASMYEVSPADQKLTNIPIGKPMANYQLHVLDAQLNLLPVGVPGELCIESVGLARGYLNQPELTRQKFVELDLLGQKRKVYRTGDLVCWQPDGNLKFLGRMDHQVKFRGFRFELGEIEAVLLGQDCVKEAVVEISRNGPVQILVAFVTLDSPPASDGKDLGFLKEALRSVLPDYMIPSRVIQLKALPLSHTGKVDRKSLREMELIADVIPVKGTTPSSLIEKKLASLWSSVLGVSQVFCEDNFFDLGGHSLLVPKLISGIQKTFSVDFPLRDLFLHPTFAAQVTLLSPSINTHHAEQEEDFTYFENEIELDPEIRPAEGMDPERIRHPKTILLTGATGFLGSWLLSELLSQTDATLVCLQRKGSGGLNRLVEILRRNGNWRGAYQDRIEIVTGDLTQRGVGLDPECYDRLSRTVDIIYHNGAWVNHTYPYAALKPANVDATLELLKLACCGQPKAFHFVSTFSVFSLAEESGIDRKQVLRHVAESSHGYAQSKWVAEQLVKAAGERGLFTTLYRPRRISGDSRNGNFNPDDFISLLLKGCLQLGRYPQVGDDIRENLAPVDFAANTLVQLSLNPDSDATVFDLLNPISVPWSLLFHHLNLRYPRVGVCDYLEWRSMLANAPDNALFPFLSVFPEHPEPGKDAHDAQVEQRLYMRTMAHLPRGHLECPPVNEKILEIYFNQFQTTKFLT